MRTIATSASAGVATTVPYRPATSESMPSTYTLLPRLGGEQGVDQQRDGRPLDCLARCCEIGVADDLLSPLDVDVALLVEQPQHRLFAQQRRAETSSRLSGSRTLRTRCRSTSSGQASPPNWSTPASSALIMRSRG
ncbi:MAG: hypothetical protein U0R67_05165 [Micropruina glycogenica]